MDDPRLEVVIDDARHFIMKTDDTFDIITSDPIHPWLKGSASLYSKEYFELCRCRLNPGGLVTQWVPLYESSTDVVKSEIATFFEVFPNGTVWSNDSEGTGYDIVLAGQGNPTTIYLDEIQQRLFTSDYYYVLESLGNAGFRSIVDLFGTYAGNKSDLTPWLSDAEINLDRNMRLQYLAGMGLNYYMETLIYDELLDYYRFPEELFIASGYLWRELESLLNKK